MSVKRAAVPKPWQSAFSERGVIISSALTVITSSLANLLVSCAFGLVSTMGFNSLDCLGIELFPTHLRYYVNY